MHAPVGSRLDGSRLREKQCHRSTRRRKMQGQMSEGDPADTRECHEEAAAEAKKPTELGSSPTAAAEAKKPTKLGGSPTAAAPPVAQKPQTGGNGGSKRNRKRHHAEPYGHVTKPAACLLLGLQTQQSVSGRPR